MGVLEWFALLFLSVVAVLLGAAAFAFVLIRAHELIDAIEAELGEFGAIGDRAIDVRGDEPRCPGRQSWHARTVIMSSS